MAPLIAELGPRARNKDWNTIMQMFCEARRASVEFWQAVFAAHTLSWVDLQRWVVEPDNETERAELQTFLLAQDYCVPGLKGEYEPPRLDRAPAWFRI